jgi:hypothetical protein
MPKDTEPFGSARQNIAEQINIRSTLASAAQCVGNGLNGEQFGDERGAAPAEHHGVGNEGQGIYPDAGEQHLRNQAGFVGDTWTEPQSQKVARQDDCDAAHAGHDYAGSSGRSPGDLVSILAAQAGEARKQRLIEAGCEAEHPHCEGVRNNIGRHRRRSEHGADDELVDGREQGRDHTGQHDPTAIADQRPHDRPIETIAPRSDRPRRC